MTDLRSIEAKIEKLLASGNARMQTEALSALISQVREYADTARAAKDLAGEIRSLEQQITKNEAEIRRLEQKSESSDDDDAKQAYALQQETLQMEQTQLKAEQAKDRFEQSRQVLRKVQADIDALRSEINKIV